MHFVSLIFYGIIKVVIKMSYICKIATLDEMEEKWNYEIEHAKDKYNWKIWKESAIWRCSRSMIGCMLRSTRTTMTRFSAMGFRSSGNVAWWRKSDDRGVGWSCELPVCRWFYERHRGHPHHPKIDNYPRCVTIIPHVKLITVY